MRFNFLHTDKRGSSRKIKSARGLLSIVASGVLMVFLFASCQNTLDKEELAKIQELSVTKQHYVSAFKEYYYRSGRALTPSNRNKEAILETEFAPYVLTTYAKDQGWADDSDSQHRRGMIERKVYAEEYREHFVLDTVTVTEREVRKLFLQYNTTLRASHLYAKSRSQAESLYSRLQNGADFEQLASQTFTNKYLAENGGDIGKFTVDDLDLAFERTAYKLDVGEISRPVKTNQGYSIIKLTDRMTKPIMTETEFVNKKDHLYTIAKRKEEEMAIRRNLADVTEKLQLSRASVNKIWSRISDRKERLWNLGSGQEVGDLELGPFKNKDLADAASFTFTGSDILEEAYYTPRESRFRIKSEFDFWQFVQGLAFRKYAINKFKQSDEFDNSSVEGSIDQTFYTYLNDRVLDSLRAGITFSEKTLREEFEENYSQYKKPLEINLARIVVSKKAQGEKAIRKLKNGAPFVSVLREYSTNSEDLMTDGELGYQSIRKLGPMAQKVKDLKEGEIGGPFKYHSNKYYVYKCLGRKEPRSQDFAEAREQVEQNLLQQRVEKKKNELIEKTKQKHNALVDLEKLENLTIEI